MERDSMTDVCSFDNQSLEHLILNPDFSTFRRTVCLYPVMVNSVNLTTNKALVRFIEDYYPEEYKNIKDSVTATVIFNSSYDVLNKTAEPIVDNVLVSEPTTLQLDYTSVFLALPVTVGREKQLIIICRGTIQPTEGYPRQFSGVKNPFMLLDNIRVSDVYNPSMRQYYFHQLSVSTDYHKKTTTEEGKYKSVCTLTEPVVDSILGIEVESTTGGSLSSDNYIFVSDPTGYFVARPHMFPHYDDLSTPSNTNETFTQYVDDTEGLCIVCYTYSLLNELNFYTIFEIHSPTSIGRGRIDITSLTKYFTTSLNVPSLGSNSYRFQNQSVSSPMLEKIGERQYKYSFIYYDSAQTPNRRLKEYTYTVGPITTDGTLTFPIDCVENDTGLTPDFVTNPSWPYGKYPLLDAGNVFFPQYGWTPIEYTWVEEGYCGRFNTSASSRLTERDHFLARTQGKDFRAIVHGSYLSESEITATEYNEYAECLEVTGANTSINRTKLIDFTFNAVLISPQNIEENYFNTWTSPSGVLTSQTTESVQDYTYTYFLYSDLSIGAFLFIEAKKTFSYSNAGVPPGEGYSGLIFPVKLVPVTWEIKLYLFANGSKILIEQYSRTESELFGYSMDTATDYSYVYEYPHLYADVTLTPPYYTSFEAWICSYSFRNEGVFPDLSSGYNATDKLIPWPTASVSQQCWSEDDSVLLNNRKLFYKRSHDGTIFHIHTPKINPTLNNENGDYIDVFVINGQVVQAQEVYDNCAIPSGTILI